MNPIENLFENLDPWNYIRTTVSALLVWIVINIGLVVGAILLENHGLSTICAILAVKAFFEQTRVRIGDIIYAWKKHKSLME